MIKKNVIKCPHCGCEYLPAEVFYPKYLLGKPFNIIRDEEGTILGYNGEEADPIETFECEHCNKKFKVEVVMTFKSEPYNDLFDEEDGEDFFNTTTKTVED